MGFLDKAAEFGAKAFKASEQWGETLQELKSRYEGLDDEALKRRYIKEHNVNCKLAMAMELKERGLLK